MKVAPLVVLFAFGILFRTPARACIWDADTLAQEKRKSPDMAKVILGQATEQVDPNPLRERIAKLKGSPRENDPEWWNDLAGAHLRLGEAKEAAELLEKVVERFPNDYGVHANLGTAYHLLGRYKEAEKEIARDLDINPGAHFGLEKYHLALLQYLVRDAKYQSRHLYVDELSLGVLGRSDGIFAPPWEDIFIKGAHRDFPYGLAEAEKSYEKFMKSKHDEFGGEILLLELSALDTKPSYRKKWNLADDPKFNEGVLYMASLNPKQPACFVMVGVACWKNRNLNLAAEAFQKAIELRSPQSEILKQRAKELRDYIKRSHEINPPKVGEVNAPKKDDLR